MPAPTTISPSPSTSTSWCRCAASGCRAERRETAMAHAPGTFDIELNLLLEGVYQKYQHDFRHYARSSLRRRIRQALERFNCPTVSRLQERVLHEPEVFAQMLQYFTVQVSEMFRDPSYFLALRRQVLSVLSTYPSVRIW